MRAATGIGVLASLAICVHACGKTPAAPTTTSQQPPPTLVGIRITGPTILSPGTTGRLTALAEWSNGSSEDVSATAHWNIRWSGPDRNRTGTNVLRVVGGGEVEAIAPGEASVSAELLSVAAQFPAQSDKFTPFNVLVLEPGTFRIAGMVTSMGVPDVASVEISSGSNAGLRTSTAMDMGHGNNGRYALYGVAAGDLQLRVSAEGFEPQARRLTVTDNVSSDFNLRPLSEPAEISGLWTLTFSASNSCHAALPEAAWQRQFDATITQQGTHFDVTLASPTLYATINRPTFRGRVFGQTMSFGVSGDSCYGDWCYPDLFDALSPTTWLGIMGSVVGTVAGHEIRGTLDSDALDVFPTESAGSSAGKPAGPPQAVCHAKDSVVVLRRK